MKQSQCKLTALRALLPFVISMLTAIQAVAADYDFQVGALYYKKLNGGTNVEVIKPPSGKYSGDIVVPADFTIGTTKYKVTAIGESAFQGSSVTSVTLPDGITTIGGWAFNDCTGLTSFTLPASITSIGQRAFYYCDKLQRLYAEASDPASYNAGSEAFSYINRASNKCTIYAPIGRSATYQNSDVFKNEGFNFGECVFINSTTFPDKNFRDYILAQDYGSDRHLSDDEIAGVTELNVSSLDIINLTGIEYFTALKVLNCSDNALSTLNVNKNTALEVLNCSHNNLSNISVNDNNTALTSLDCSYNHISDIVLTKNTELDYLCCDANQLEELDVSYNTKLKTLSCNQNKLTELNVSKNTVLENLYCSANQIYDQKMDDLINTLHAGGGGLYVYSSDPSEGNDITTLQVAAAKTKGWTAKKHDGSNWVDYAGSNVIAIDASNFPNTNFRNWLLSQKYGKDGYLSEKEIANVRMIEVDNKNIDDLTGIELFTELETLTCGNNKLKTLDVSKNTKLGELMCDMNQLTTLDVSNNLQLEFLSCSYNQLTTLDLSKNTYLCYLLIYNNQIRGKGMAALIKCLPTVLMGYMIVCSKENPTSYNEILTAQVDAVKEKGWHVAMRVGDDFEDYAGVPATAIDATNFPDDNFRNWILSQDYGDDGYLTDSEIAGVTEMNVAEQGIANLTGIGYFTALTSLDCYGNNLTTMDLSANVNLTTLSCGANNLTSLNLSQNTVLTELLCAENLLETLDLSKNTILKTLDCSSNKMTSLDMSNNKVLENLWCQGNTIYSEGMQTLVNSLCQNGGELCIYSSENDGNKITMEQVAVAMSKGWSVFMWDGNSKDYYNGILLGDANGDNKVDVADIVAIVSHQKGKDVNGFSLPAADVNNDGKADEKDIELILPMIMGE